MADRKPTAVRRTEIADAALDIIASRGIAALSTRGIAHAVGLTTGALFKHFPSRDAVLLGVAERVAELLRATCPDDTLPPLERLDRFASARLSLVSARAGVLTLVLSEQFSLALPDAAVTVLRDVLSDTHAFVTRAVAEGQRDGMLRADIPADGLALLFMGAMQMTALARRARVVSEGASALEVLDALVRPSIPVEDP